MRKHIALGFFFGFIILLDLFSVKGDKFIYPLSRPFQDIIESFKKENTEITIVNYDSEFIDSVMPDIAQDLPFLIQNLNKSSAQFNLMDSAVLTFSSVDSLIEFNRKVTFSNSFAKPMKFYVHCQRASFDEISLLNETKNLETFNFEDDFSEIISFQYYLLEEGDYFRLLTFIWYAPGQCNVRQLIEVNKFSKDQNRWLSLSFEIKKFRNFYGCRLVFGHTKQRMTFYIDSTNYSRSVGSLSYHGLHYEVIKGLANHLNYTFFMNPIMSQKLMRYVYDDVADVFMILNCYNLNIEERGRKSSITQAYFFIQHYMAVPVGQRIGNLKKLLMPFDSTVWILIMCTLAVAFSIIFIVCSLNDRIRNCVVGANVRTPSLNVLSHFFGVPQSRLPLGNFARFLVIVYTMYCIIMRAAWQGKMVHIMHKDLRQPEIKSVEELIEKNYTMFMTFNFERDFKGGDIMNR